MVAVVNTTMKNHDHSSRVVTPLQMELNSAPSAAKLISKNQNALIMAVKNKRIFLNLFLFNVSHLYFTDD